MTKMTGSRSLFCAVCLGAALLGCALGQSPTDDNPFLTGPMAPGSPITAPINVDNAPESEVLAPALEPSGESGPGCACKAGTSADNGAANRTGCGQWDIISGSNAFTCYIEVRRWHFVSVVGASGES